MLAFIDKVLSKLPGNGKKTVLGMVSLVLGAAVSKFMPADQALELAARVMEYFGWSYGALGLVHKAVK